MLNSTLDKIFNHIKIVGLIAPFFGIYFIVNYFAQNKIPLPEDVKSALFLIPVIAIAGLLISIYSLVGLFMPSIFLDWTGMNIKPLFYDNKDATKLPALIYRYVLLYGGAIALMFSFGFFPTLLNGTDGTYIWGFIGSLIHASLVIAHLRWDKKFLWSEAGKYFGYVALTTLVFLIWFVFVVILGLRAIEELFHGLSDMGAFWIIFLAMISLHFFQTVVYSKIIDEKPQQRNKLIIGLSIVAVLTALLPTVAPYIGKATLYFFDLGGGKPIRLRTTAFQTEAMPAWLEAKERDSAVIYLIFKSPSNIYLHANKDSKLTDKMSLKEVRRIEYLSSKGEVEFIDHAPFTPPASD